MRGRRAAVLAVVALATGAGAVMATGVAGAVGVGANASGSPAAVDAATGGGAAKSGAATGPGARAAAVRRVRVADDFFSPRRLRVRRGTVIRWVWSNRNSNAHDVRLARGPRGVRRFNSPPATTRFSFRRKLRRPGVYRVLCTFHQGMTMRIAVRRR